LRIVKRALAFLLLAFGVSAAAAPVELAPGVHLLRGSFVAGRQPDGNSVLLEGPEGIVVVDSGRHAAHTRAILDLAAARKRPLRAVINTHWHLDHTGGNALLRREVPGVKIFASGAIDSALDGFLANYASQLSEVIAKTEGEERERYRTELALIQAGRQLAPDEVISRSGAKVIAGRELELRIESHAVTAGDVWLLDRASGTLIAGDLVTLPVPFFDTACPARWKESLAGMAKEKFDRLVPGHGPVLTPAEFAQYRSAFDELLACGASARSNEECTAGWLKSAGALVSESEQELTKQALGYYLDNFLRPGAKVAHLCE
jgi:glyoxylase-like metal-dependent hydrolase (beta-lactamase superfamily II)